MKILAKKALSLLCVFAMLFSLVVTVNAADPITFTAESKTVELGEGTEEIVVPVSVAGNTGILGMALKVKYAEGLTLTKVEKGDALTSLAFTKPGNLAENPVKCVWDGESDADTSNGVIVNLTFTVPKDVAKEYAIEITPEGVVDDMLDYITVSAVNGKISVVGSGSEEPEPPHEHEYDEGVVTKEPTCTEDGGKT